MPGRDSERDRRSDDPPDPSVEHPGKKYQKIADKYAESGSDFGITSEFSGTSTEDAAAESQASPKLRASFWALVVVFNLALLGVSLGPMVIVFEGNWTLGTQLTAGGLLLFGFGLYRYRQTKRRLEDGTLTGEHKE